jgi:hypothetical protein
VNLPKDIFSDVELQTLSAGSTVQLIGSCRIGRNTPTNGDDAWAQISADNQCRLFKARSTKQMVIGGAIRTVTLFNLQLTLGTDIGPADQVEKDGLLYEVQDTDEGTDYAVYLTAFLTRVRDTEIVW